MDACHYIKAWKEEPTEEMNNHFLAALLKRFEGSDPNIEPYSTAFAPILLRQLDRACKHYSDSTCHFFKTHQLSPEAEAMNPQMIDPYAFRYYLASFMAGDGMLANLYKSMGWDAFITVPSDVETKEADIYYFAMKPVSTINTKDALVGLC